MNRTLVWMIASGALVAHAAGCGDSEEPVTEGATTSSGTAGGGAGATGGEGGAKSGGAGGEGAGGTGGKPEEGECGAQKYHPYKAVYWGDLHVHTSYSIDSYTAANRNDPAAAYAFARDQSSLPLAEGAGAPETATIDEPLDFAAITDHSEFFTITGQCLLGEPGNDDLCADFTNQGSAQQGLRLATLLGRLLAADPPGLPGCDGAQGMAECTAAAESTWSKIQQAAANANDPCEFTSLVAYEWTATTGGSNLHQNVIFASDNVPDAPVDYINYPSAYELWQGLEASCDEAIGCDVITITHNSNLSNGEMFDAVDNPLAHDYMRKYQRLVEIYQHKGASECVPMGPLSDPECAFEDADDGNPITSAPGYVRNALARGLQLQQNGEMNPLALGIVGATDTHNGAPGYVAEQGWKGHIGNADVATDARLDQATFGPGGVTAVWAHENTRSEIYGALKRRESYATSGPRMTIRFYALGNVDEASAAAYCSDPGFPKALVDAGAVPMGADVSNLTSPTFFMAGAAANAPLESVELIRLGLNEQGVPTMRIETMPLNGGEQMMFCKSFTEDGSYDATQPWIYYVRMLEQPTPRWSSYDCIQQPDHEACSDPTVPSTIKERAWTSPIFVSP